jgi:uncharacterized membrane protein
MKKLELRSLTKPFLALLALLLAAGLAYASWYTITTITGKVTIKEAITIDRVEFGVSLYPGELTTQTFSLSNSSAIPVTVRLEGRVEPPGLRIEVPGEVEIPANGQKTFEILIHAPPYIEPGEYIIKIDVTR